MSWTEIDDYHSYFKCKTLSFVSFVTSPCWVLSPINALSLPWWDFVGFLYSLFCLSYFNLINSSWQCVYFCLQSLSRMSTCTCERNCPFFSKGVGRGVKSWTRLFDVDGFVVRFSLSLKGEYFTRELTLTWLCSIGAWVIFISEWFCKVTLGDIAGIRYHHLGPNPPTPFGRISVILRWVASLKE